MWAALSQTAEKCSCDSLEKGTGQCGRRCWVGMVLMRCFSPKMTILMGSQCCWDEADLPTAADRDGGDIQEPAVVPLTPLWTS